MIWSILIMVARMQAPHDIGRSRSEILAVRHVHALRSNASLSLLVTKRPCPPPSQFEFRRCWHPPLARVWGDVVGGHFYVSRESPPNPTPRNYTSHTGIATPFIQLQLRPQELVATGKKSWFPIENHNFFRLGIFEFVPTFWKNGGHVHVWGVGVWCIISDVCLSKFRTMSKFRTTPGADSRAAPRLPSLGRRPHVSTSPKVGSLWRRR